MFVGGEANVGTDRQGWRGNRIIGSNNADWQSMRVLGEQRYLLSGIPQTPDCQHRFFFRDKWIEVNRISSGRDHVALKIVAVSDLQHLFHPARSRNHSLGAAQSS